MKPKPGHLTLAERKKANRAHYRGEACVACGKKVQPRKGKPYQVARWNEAPYHMGCFETKVLPLQTEHQQRTWRWMRADMPKV